MGSQDRWQNDAAPGLSAAELHEWAGEIKDEAATARDALLTAAALDPTIAADVADTGSDTRAALAKLFVPAVIVTGTGIDPTGATDSTAAIQALADANPGRDLLFPPGVFTFSTLNFGYNQHPRGSGWSDFRDRAVFLGDPDWLLDTNFKGTVLRSTATTGSAITIAHASEVGTGSLSDFILIGPGSGTSIGITLGGAAVAVVHPVWRNVKVGNFATGVKMQHVNEGSFYDLTIHGCTTGLTTVTDVNNNAFYMLDVQRCTSVGVFLSATTVADAFYSPISQINGVGFSVDGYRHAFFNPYGEATTASWAIDVVDGRGHVIVAPYLSGAADGIRVQSNARDVTITGFGYGSGGAPLVNAGIRTYIQGYTTDVLTDTGTSTTLIDPGRAGTLLGVRATYTPTVSGITLGNGVVTGRWQRAGKTVIGSITLTLGSTTAMTGLATFSLPVAPSHASAGRPASACLLDAGSGTYAAMAVVVAASVVYVGPAAGSLTAFTATTPFTWAAGDTISVDFQYETA